MRIYTSCRRGLLHKINAISSIKAYIIKPFSHQKHDELAVFMKTVNGKQSSNDRSCHPAKAMVEKHQKERFCLHEDTETSEKRGEITQVALLISHAKSVKMPLLAVRETAQILTRQQLKAGVNCEGMFKSCHAKFSVLTKNLLVRNGAELHKLPANFITLNQFTIFSKSIYHWSVFSPEIQ